jgi:hypothetical protein
MAQKPEVTAPTPANGRVLYGDGPRTLPEGWGMGAGGFEPP